MFARIVTLALTVFIAHGATAHEYWLEASDYTVSSGEDVQIGVFIGQKFKGNEYPYNAAQHQRFMLIDSAGLQDLGGELGDKPAITVTPRNPGLNIFADISSTQKLIYDDPETFLSFLEHVGLQWVMEQHNARGLPASGFGEGYTRFVKSLVSVDGGAGNDVRLGMMYEIVALSNPYTDNMANGLPVRVFFEGRPLANTQIEIFRKGEEETQTVRTNSSGTAMIPVTSGLYMINTVHMVTPPAADIEITGAVWHSLWASMTFEIP